MKIYADDVELRREHGRVIAHQAKHAINAQVLDVMGQYPVGGANLLAHFGCSVTAANSGSISRNWFGEKIFDGIADYSVSGEPSQ